MSTGSARSAAIDAIHAASRGVPRLVNQLCDAALVYGFSERAPRIDATIVQEVLKDKDEGGLLEAGREVRVVPTVTTAGDA